MINTIWQDLVTAALMGTERKAFVSPTTDSALGALLSQIDGADKEGALLRSSAAVSAYLRTGKLPQTLDRLAVGPCEVDDSPCCGTRASMHLDSVIKGDREDIVLECLSAISSAGKRVPENKLPGLLDMGRRSTALRDPIQQVIGNRGRWLAAQNPDWSYVAGKVDESSWETGSKAERLALLKEVRAVEPARAREMVASTWDEDNAEERAAFVGAFEIGLSIADEPFLENALDDRRKEVRKAASDLLCRVPESGLCKRMIERATPLLKLTAGQKAKLFSAGRKAQLEVTLPEACDKTMVRDGVEQKPQWHVQMGEKAWWLMQMLAAIPPDYWCKAWESSPGELLGAAYQTEWKDSLIEGWKLAAERHQDGDWAEELMLDMVARNDHADARNLMNILPVERREELVSKNLPSNTGLALLYQCEHLWSESFSRTVLDVFSKRIILNNKWYDWQMQTLCLSFARCMWPHLFPEAEARLTPVIREGGKWAEHLSEFLTILEFRHEMLYAINSKD